MDVWDLVPTDLFERRLKEHQKKHREETRAVLDNLDSYHRAVSSGADPHKRHFGFMHTEPMGVVAIDQRGAARRLRETRLYVCPDAVDRKLFLVTIGDKRSQNDDIQACKAFVQQMRKKGEGND